MEDRTIDFHFLTETGRWGLSFPWLHFKGLPHPCRRHPCLKNWQEAFKKTCIPKGRERIYKFSEVKCSKKREAIVWNKKSIWSLVKLSEKVKAFLFSIQCFITIGNAMDLKLKVNKIHTGKKPSSFSQAVPFNSECFCILCADRWLVRKWTLFSLIYLQLFDKGLRSGGQVG